MAKWKTSVTLAAHTFGHMTFKMLHCYGSHIREVLLIKRPDYYSVDHLSKLYQSLV